MLQDELIEKCYNTMRDKEAGAKTIQELNKKIQDDALVS